MSIIAKQPTLRVTSEFDNDNSVYFHKISCKLLENLAKLKLMFQNNKGEVAKPRLSFVSKYLSLDYDVEEQNALVKGLSPLSAPDLRLLIDRLQVLSLYIKSKVQHYILSHHDDFYYVFSQCSDAISRSEHISVQVADLLWLISDHPIDTEIRDVIGEIKTKRKEAKEKKELLKLIKLILELTEKLKFTKEELRAGRVIRQRRQ